MPELWDGSIFLGLFVAVLFWIFANRSGKKRYLFFLGAVAIGITAAYLGPPVLAFLISAWLAVPGLPVITEGAFFIGLWVALLSLTLFEHKDQRRRVPIWAGISLGFVAALVVPPFMDGISGAYQNASLRSDVNGCTRWMAGESSLYQVTNICDYSIVVGICLPNEKNPKPCEQSAELAPGDMAKFDRGGFGLSALPSNPNGYTVVACLPPNRPSRTLSVMGRGYKGVCLPKG